MLASGAPEFFDDYLYYTRREAKQELDGTRKYCACDLKGEFTGPVRI